MAVLPVGATGATPYIPKQITTPNVSGTEKTSGAENSFFKGLESAEKLQTNANDLANQLATGQLENVHDFTTAAAKASLAVSLTAALRNRAVEAYQDIMRMQV